MLSASHHEIQNLLGDVDALVIERILETHASLDEVAEALAGAEDERMFGARREPSSPRVNEVREILAEVLDETEDDGAFA